MTTRSTKRQAATKSAEKEDKSRTIHRWVQPGQTEDELLAQDWVRGYVANAAVALQFSAPLGSTFDLTECHSALIAQARAVQGGDLRDIEGTLTAQMVALNALFAHFSTIARGTTNLDHIERVMRIALRAQGQYCRTAETVAVIKNPPVFARQANIAHGPQQVNNHPTRETAQPVDEPSRASGPEPRKIKLLEQHAEPLDTGTTSKTTPSDSPLAAVGTLNGTAHAGR